MTREEQTERVRDAVVDYLGTRVDFQPWSLAQWIVDALVEPPEVTVDMRERAMDAAFEAKGRELSYTEESWLDAALRAALEVGT